jgi:alternate signal-mediated exported protein
MKNNKKKANKEKRVMAAALCITAVAVAGSTFAWFTSTDEVTNRLSANADYNVSIVESFAPPENWMPGSSVNKDVYATNTGNIGAFVNEDVSGVLTITTERPVATFSQDCVELTEEERYVMEAGAFLAFKPEASNAKLGDQIVIRPGDQGDPAKTDFTPDADGLYVFRRSIVVDNNTRDEGFEYAGYYYSNNKFYKISNLETDQDTTPDKADDGVKTDGNLAAARSGYYKLEQKVVNPVDLEYDAANHRLVAAYDTGVTTATQEEKEAAAEAYDKAIHAYELANEEQKRAAQEYSTANAEVEGLYQTYIARNGELATATSTLNTATTNQANAESAYNTLNTEKSNLEGQRDNLLTQMYGQAPGSEDNYVADTSLYAQSIKTIGEANDNQRLVEEVNAWLGTSPAGVTHTTFATLTYDELKKFTPSAELHTYYLDYVKKQKAIEDYTTLKGQYDTIAARLEAIGNDTTGELGTAKQTLDAANTALTAAQADFDAKKAANDTAYNAYKDKLEASGVKTDNLDAADAALASASAAMTNAKKAYDKAMAAPTDSKLKFNIYLNNDVTTGGEAGKWQLDPTTIGDDNTAHFYYTSILGAGETSNKLIDRVELDSSTTKDMYESFDFDINVALKSAQVVFDEDQETILATAATEEIGKTPSLGANTKDIKAPLTWS